MDGSDVSKGVVPILAPVGRDAATIAGLVERTGLWPQVRLSPVELVAELEQTVEVVIVAEEALYGSNLAPVERWVEDQPPWSDQPFIVLTNHNEGPRFAAFRRELVRRLRNVTFLERPLQAITLQATVLSAGRARRRQYQARAYLNAQRETAAQLEQLVAERTWDLEQANIQLREEIATRERAQAALLQAQKIEALGQLVGGVAHDFNNLLMAVMGNLDLLAKRLGADPRQNRLLNGAMEGARRGATLTQRLLAFARKQELQSQPTDVEGLLEGMKGLIDRSVGPMVQVDIEAEPDLPAVIVDPNQLEMALLNLAVNARDAMPLGGGLTISIGREEIGAESKLGPKLGSYVLITVHDSGEGMDAETLAKAVEPFFSTKGVGKGTGLGLSMVFGLAEQSGGALRLESTPGKGTKVCLWLPVAAEAARTVEFSSDPLEPMSPARILLVDDDPLIAGSTVALLEDLGHIVVEANSGVDALRRLSIGLQPDLMITDYAMPGMTGLELAREVQRIRPDLPVLLATGFADLEDAAHIDLPRLAKPYTQDQLAAQIAQLLPGHASKP
jgi:signal transduction histidine kinase/CheY-like chemotaxis protein